MLNNKTDKQSFMRLPKIGDRCPHTGLSRTTLTCILKSGNVRSHTVQLPGRSRGCRVIDVQSLLDYIGSCRINPPKIMKGDRMLENKKSYRKNLKKHCDEVLYNILNQIPKWSINYSSLDPSTKKVISRFIDECVDLRMSNGVSDPLTELVIALKSDVGWIGSVKEGSVEFFIDHRLDYLKNEAMEKSIAEESRKRERAEEHKKLLTLQ